MLDDTTAPLAQDWSNRAHAVLDGCSRELAEALAPGHGAADMQVFPIKVGQGSISLRLQVGDGLAFLKVFDGEAPDTRDNYDRERAVLLSMRGSGLVPEVLAYSDPRRLLLMKYVGAEVSAGPGEHISPDDLAYRIGTWTARFEAFAPSKPATGNWYQYFRKFGAAVPIERVEAAFEVLSDIPLCGLVIARNDSALHNFLVREDGHLVGCDFEKARLRPRGWDYVMTYHALIQRFPDQADTVLSAYADGFSRAHRGALIVDELNDAARLLFCARVIAAGSDEERN